MFSSGDQDPTTTLSDSTKTDWARSPEIDAPELGIGSEGGKGDRGVQHRVLDLPTPSRRFRGRRGKRVPYGTACDFVHLGADAASGETDSNSVTYINGSGKICHKWNDDVELVFNDQGLELDAVASTGRLWIGKRQTLCTIRSAWMPPLSTDLPWAALKESTKAALVGMRVSQCIDPAFIEIHIDGSGSDDCAWSFCVLWAADDGEWAFAGALTGPVVTSSTLASFIGSAHHDSNAAEMSGFTWAFSFILQHATAGYTKCKVMYDSEFAAHAASGTWNVGEYTCLSKVENALFNMVQAVTTIELEHEKAHADLPFNELVDTLCTCFIEDLRDERQRCWYGDASWSPVYDLALQPAAAQWLFVPLLPPQHQTQYPLWYTDDDIFLSLEACPVARWGIPADIIGQKIDKFQADELHEADCNAACTSLPIKLVQINPCTLRDAAKRKSYFDQARSAGAHVLFLQEMRRRQYGISVENGFITASSAADKGGHGGCMISVSASLPFASDANGSLLPAKVVRDDVNILYGDPRTLIVRVAAPRFQSICVSIHGLDRDHGREEVHEAWRKTGDQLAKCLKKGDSVCCGIDGNCRIGRKNNNDTSIGDLLDVEARHDFVSDAMVLFARRFSLRIVNTYSHLSNGKAAGSLHTVQGIALRCDYLLVGQAVQVQDQSCEVWSWFRMSNMRPDHMPVSAVVSVLSQARPPVSRRRVAVYDRKAVKAACEDKADSEYAEQVARLEQHLRSLPPIPFFIDPSTHVFILDCHFLEGLQSIFPLVRARVKQGYISAATFALILEKGKLLHSLSAYGNRLKSSPIRFVVRFWAAVSIKSRRVKEPWWCRTRGFKPKWFCMQQHWTLKSVIRISIQVKEAKRQDFEKLCISQARSLEEAALENCTSKLFGLIKVLKPFQPRRDTRISGADEVPARSDAEERLIVRGEFRERLQGTDTTLTCMIQDDRSSCAANAVELKRIPLDINAVPSKQFVTRLHAKGRMNGLGEAGIGGEVSRLLPLVTSDLFLPVHFKAAFTMRLPIQWLGGALQELFKGKGSMSLITNFRDITLADLNGKHFGSFIRSCLYVAVQSLVGPSQHGSGCNGGTTDICHLGVSQLFSLARAKKSSAGVLFIDQVSAFARIGRRLALPDMPQSEEGWRLHVRSLGFSREESDQIIDGAMTVLQWQDAGASTHALKLLQKTHVKSWFSTDGLAGVVQFTLGTLAGTSLADLVFILCMAVVIRKLTADLKAADLISYLPTADVGRFYGADDSDWPLVTMLPLSAWVDDLTIPVLCHADHLFEKAIAVMDITWAAFTCHAMEVNMKAGKSEFLPLYAGPHALRARQREATLPKDADSATPTLLCKSVGADGKKIRLRVVKSYTHMGKRTVASGAQTEEITQRHNSTLPFANRLAWKFFRESRAAWDKKMLVASSLLLSKELYGAGSFPILVKGERQKLHSNVMSVIRKATETDMAGETASRPKLLNGDEDLRCKPELLSDAECLNIFECRAPYATVRFLRMRMSVRFALRAPVDLKVLVFAAFRDGRSWLKALQSDLTWANQCDPDFRYDLSGWFAFAYSEPQKARVMVRRICDSKAARSITIGEHLASITSLQEAHTCFCGRSFPSKPALDGHRATFHGAGAPEYRYCQPTGQCACCLVTFSNRKLLAHHMRYRSGWVCLVNTMRFVAPLSDLELKEARRCDRAVESMREKRGQPRYLADVPAFRSYGPLRQIVNLRGDEIDVSSNLHPFGPKRRKYRVASDEDDDQVDDEDPLACDEIR